MRVRFTYEQDSDDRFAFADLPGFYLWATSGERLLNSVVPLVQHVVWANREQCVVPCEELPVEELLTHGETTLAFKEVERLARPTLLVDGEWWRSPGGVLFFVPKESTEHGDVMESRILERIKQELADGRLP